jgi:HK97 family phage portal protein
MNILKNLRNFFTRSKDTKFVLSAYVDKSGSGSAAILQSNNLDPSSFAAIDLIAAAFANLTIGVYNKKNRQKQTDNPVYLALKKPNLEDSRFLFYYTLATDYYKDGNAYIYVYRDTDNNVVSLFRLEPWKVNVYKNDYGRKVYQYNGEEYNSDKVIQIASRYGYDGLRGYPIFNECRKAFSLTENLNDYTNSLFNNGLGKRTVIDISKAFPNATDDQIQQIREKYQNAYSGIENAGKSIVKTNGVEFSTIDSGLPENRNNQLIENRDFQQKEIFKLFGIPEGIMNGDNSNIENIYMSFVERAVKPLAVQFEEALNNLFTIQEQKKFYIEYSYNELLKTSLQSRIEAYSKQFNIGILSPNEIREKENLEPYEAGDNHFIAANLMPVNNETVNAYMAGAKQKAAELEQQNNDAAGVGDDKK